MSLRRCDVAIIGAGSAGMAAHAAASRAGAEVLLIEGGDYGTTCARNGCMPSKLLLAAADARRHVDDAGEFGLRVAGVEVDGAAVMQRVRRLRDDFVGSVLDVIERIPETQRLRGMARFVAPGRLQVNANEVEARAVVIATGSEPFVPPAYAGLGDRLLTSDTIFELATLPESLAVIGGGVIGLELGQAMHRLGVRVRLFERGTRLGLRGDDALARLSTTLLAAAVPCELGVLPEIAASDGDGVELAWEDLRQGRRRERFERVLVATGRRPRLQGLQLGAAGLALDDRGIPQFDPLTMRCGDSAVFIAGDVNGDRPLLHEAAGEGRLAGENAARYPEPRAHRRRVLLQIAFTEPQFASVGRGPYDPGGDRLAVGTVSFARQGRSRVIHRAAGELHVYGDRASGKLVGARMIGPAVEHLAHLLAWSIEQEVTVASALALPYYHPVIEEGVRTALTSLRHAMDRGEPPRRDCLDCGPGT